MSRRLAIGMLLSGLLAGCADNVTRDNFDRIQIGMSRAEVEAILGPAQSYQGGILSWSGGHEQRVITVILDDRGQVSEKSADGL